MTLDYTKALGARLRTIRQQQGLSLGGVEQKSRGRWKAVVVGSYERGDRAISVHKLSELAEFYGVPVDDLLPGDGTSHRSGGELPRLVFDLAQLHGLASPEAIPLARFLGEIAAMRHDYNGKVLEIRRDDLGVLALMYGDTPEHLAERFISWGVLRPAAADRQAGPAAR